MNWLDTETMAILQREEEPKLAPPKVAEFALVLINKGVDPKRLIRAVTRVNNCSHSSAKEILCNPSPITINLDLTEEEATFGQFELICCDAIAAVIRSEVAARADWGYLWNLLHRVSLSPEFKPVEVTINDIPLNESGKKFVDQFLGLELQELRDMGFPRRFNMPMKKARIMKHWAGRIGVQVSADAV
jgi:hypothetical protein